MLLYCKDFFTYVELYWRDDQQSYGGLVGQVAGTLPSVYPLYRYMREEELIIFITIDYKPEVAQTITLTVTAGPFLGSSPQFIIIQLL